MEISITAPRGFSFKRTVISHGWCDLPPFEFDEEKWTLSRVIGIGDAHPITVKVSEAGRNLKVSLSRKIGKRAQSSVERQVRHMFRLDDDMTAFYEAMAQDPAFEWIVKAGAGRLLRSPTVFEDLVKTICTTNCSWALTKKMIKELVGSLGREARGGGRNFPTPEAMASVTESFYRDHVRAGYRAPYLKELAESVASGSLDVEAWLASDLPAAELKRAMKRVKGVGDYAAENLLKLVGRYDVLALDSWVRSTFARIHNGGRTATDKKIERYYARFGPWRGLALWCDMTREWMDRDEQFISW